MDDALFVRRLEGVGDLSGNRQRLGEGHGPARDEHGKVLALDEFHDKGAAATRACRRGRQGFDPVDLGDVGMIE